MRRAQPFLAGLMVLAGLLGTNVVDGRGGQARSSVDWFVIELSASCSDSVAESPEADRAILRRTDALCVPGEVAEFEVGDEFQVEQEDSFVRLRVAPSFSFATEDLAVGAVLVPVGGPPAAQLLVEFVPEVQIEVAWADLPATASEEASLGLDVDGVSGDEVGAATEEPRESASETDSVTIGSRGVRKTISISGRDAPSLDDPETASRFRLRESLPASLDVVANPADGEVGLDALDLSLTQRPVVYDLISNRLAGAEISAEQQSTELWLDGSALVARTTLDLNVVGPPIDLAVEQTGFDGSRSVTTISITVQNTGEVPLRGPMNLTLRAPDFAVFEQFENATEDAKVTDRTVIAWSLPDELLPGETTVRQLDARLRPGPTDAVVSWVVELTRTGEATTSQVVLAREELTTDVPTIETDGSGEREVNFTPGQLIRLIAFVIAFALLAIIFGAWSRNRRIDMTLGGEEADAQRKHERSIFKSFAEAIIVLVILVSILVLALQGSLQAESAASLIGVIAGYALGQRK
ncbi:MAG: hypothetical protein ACR2QO_23150 [Acidimicrobiales bacterium]